MRLTEPQLTPYEALARVGVLVREGTDVWDAIGVVAEEMKPRYTHEQALDFDFSQIAWHGWYEERRNDVDWVSPDKSHEGKVPAPRYGSPEEIFALYNQMPDPGQIAIDMGLEYDIDRITDDILAADEPLF